jgi:hypothetical protein
MHYEINVSYQGWHLFATAERSIKSTLELKKVMTVFKVKFPEEEGYSVSVTRLETKGYEVNLEEMGL